MIFDIETVRNVSNLYVQFCVDDVMDPERHKAAAEFTVRKAAERLQRDAQTFAADINMEDIHVEQFRKEPDMFLTYYRVAWRPRTVAAELHGGYVDGQVFAVEGLEARDLIKIPAPLPMVSSLDGNQGEIRRAPEPLEYVYAGYNNTTRNLVYRLRTVA